jgi:hypothetical protein
VRFELPTPPTKKEMKATIKGINNQVVNLKINFS